MLPVARWSMKGMPQATLVALVASAVPWLFWFGAAIAALVTLRKGMAPAMPVIATPQSAPVQRRTPSAIACATGPLTAPWQSSRSAGTPNIDCLMALE